MLRTVIAVPHALTAWNRINRIQGKSGPPLDDRGVIEARGKAAIITELKLGPQLVIASGLPRSDDTARTIAMVLRIPWQTDERLQECCFGSLEGCFEAELVKRYSSETVRSLENYHNGTFRYDFRSMDGEDDAAVRSRHLSLWRDLATITEVPTIILVGHGRGLNTLLHALGLTPPLLKRGDVRVIPYAPPDA